MLSSKICNIYCKLGVRLKHWIISHSLVLSFTKEQMKPSQEVFSPDAKSVFVLEELKYNEVPDLRLYKIRSAWLVLKLQF